MTSTKAWWQSKTIWASLIAMLAGAGSLAGPALGALLFVGLPEYLRVAETWRLVTYGFILVAATIFMPRGLVPLLGQALRAWRERGQPPR